MMNFWPENVFGRVAAPTDDYIKMNSIIIILHQLKQTIILVEEAVLDCLFHDDEDAAIVLVLFAVEAIPPLVPTFQCDCDWIQCDKAAIHDSKSNQNK